MEKEYMDDQESLNPEEEDDSLNDSEETTESNDDEVSKLKELVDNYKIRAEKAERKLKGPKEEAPKSNQELSQSDIIYLAKADIHEDDLDEFLEIARNQKKSLKEVHSKSWVRTWLSERNEERKSATVASTGNNRVGAKAASGTDLRSKAIQGDMPDSEEEIAKLIDARYNK